jgi:putative transcriptional regulator
LVMPPADIDVREIRRRLRLSQRAFALKFGFSPRTVQEWEQGRAQPDRPARLLLAMIARAPKTVERVLRRL